jgi:hypothetical protein
VEVVEAVVDRSGRRRLDERLAAAAAATLERVLGTRSTPGPEPGRDEEPPDRMPEGLPE